MATKKASAAMEFIVAQLKKNKKAAYADIKKAAEAKKLKIYPIMYGRAQAMLGIVKARPRGQGKAASRKRAAAAGARSRPRKGGTTFDTSTLEGLITAVKSTENEKERYRHALEKIHSILSSVLG